MGSWEEVLSNADRRRSEMEVGTGLQEKQKEESLTRLQGHLDRLQIRVKLEDIKNKVWKGGEIFQLVHNNLAYRESVGFSYEDVILEGAVEVALQLRYSYKKQREVIDYIPSRGLEPSRRRHTGIYDNVGTNATITIGVANFGIGRNYLPGPPTKGDVLYVIHEMDSSLYQSWGIRNASDFLSLPTPIEKLDKFVLDKLALVLNPQFMPPKIN